MKNFVFIILTFCFSQITNSQSLYDTVSVKDKLYGLSKFWKEASYNFVFFDQTKIDWDSAYQAYIPRVLQTKNLYEYYLALGDFAELLKDGHTSVGLDDKFWKDAGPTPVFLRKSGGKYFVRRITEELSRKIPLGTEVLSINGMSVDSFRKVMPHSFLKGTVLKYNLKSPAGKVYKAKVATIVGKDWPKWVSEDAGTQALQLPAIDIRELQSEIGYVQINTFGEASIVAKFDSLLPRMQKFKALVIDIRQNGGGNSDYARKIAEHLVDKDYTVGSAWSTRVHRSANKAWGSWIVNRPMDPEVIENQGYFRDSVWEHHPGDTVKIPPSYVKLGVPIVVLMGPNTFSAAEDFLILLDGSRNITTMGRRSGGSSGQPLFVALPCGISARICAKRDTYPNGRDFINIGIRPDVFIPRNPGGVVNATDIELQKAISYLQTKLN